MKKSIFTLLIFSVTFGSYAQVTFKTMTSPYTEFADGSSVNLDSLWDDGYYDFDEDDPREESYNIIDGFVFKAFDISFEDIVEVGGAIEMYNETYDTFFSAGVLTDIIDMGYLVNEDSVSLSPNTYKISGDSGSRILSYQYKNFGFYGSDEESAPYDFGNMQIRLYEESSILEIHFGESKVNNPLTSFEEATGLVTGGYVYGEGVDDILIHDMWFNTGDSTDPIFEFLHNTAADPDFEGPELISINGFPPSGTVYQYDFSGTNGLASINKTKPVLVNAYPNPTSRVIYFDIPHFTHGELMVSNLLGEVVMKKTLDDTAVDLSDFNNGVYVATIIDSNGVVYRSKVIKQ